MWYQVTSPLIALTRVPEEGSDAYPSSLVKEADGRYRIHWNDEGFSEELDLLEPILKTAKKSGQFKVHLEDHKGMTSFKVKFGPDYFEEL
jgi:hypothetical protein